MHLLLSWLIGVLGLVVSAWIAHSIGFDIHVDMEKPVMVFVGAGLLGIVNMTIGTILKIMTVPLACATFGLAWLVINALLFWWVGTWNVGFHVGDFWAALFGSFLMSLFVGTFNRYRRENEASA